MMGVAARPFPPVLAAAVLLAGALCALLRAGGEEGDLRSAIQLPRVGKTVPFEEAGIEVLVAADGATWLGGREVGWRELDECLCSRGPDGALIVADKRAPWTIVRAVTWMCAEAPGMDRVHWAVDSRKEGVYAPGLWLPAGTSGGGLRIALAQKGDQVEVVTGDGPLGMLPATGRGGKIRATIEEYADWYTSEAALLTAGEGVSFGSVLRLAEICRKAGIEVTLFLRGRLPLDNPPARPPPPEKDDRSIEEIRRSVSPPECRTAGEPPGGDETFVEVLVGRDRQIRADGLLMDSAFFRRYLEDRAATRMVERADGKGSISDTPVRIVADGEALWRDVQEVHAACARSRIHRVYWEVVSGGKRGLMPARLPIDATGAGSTAPEEHVTVKLARNWGRDRTRVFFGNEVLGGFEDARGTIGSRLFAAKKSDPEIRVKIDAWGSVPFREVLALLAMCRSAGFERVDFGLVWK